MKFRVLGPISILAMFLVILPSRGKTIHIDGSVADNGGDGSFGSPYKYIDQGAAIAQPGDSVLIETGTYRECVKPVKGGTAEARIIYEAAPGAEVVVKGSEVVNGWVSITEKTHAVAITPELVGDYNPFAIHPPLKSERVLGQVFLEGLPLTEKFSMEDVETYSRSWTVSAAGDTVYANFAGNDPNQSMVELAVREQIFAPATYNLGYITIGGITFEHSANNYPHLKYKSDGIPEKGAVSTGGGHDWIIENCTVRYSKTLAIDFGIQGIPVLLEAGYGDVITGDRNLYVEIGRIGHHIIRNNIIEYAGDGGLVAYWSPYCRIENNILRNCNYLDFGGYATAVIKPLFFIEGIIEGNYLYDNGGDYIWVDNGYQGSRITRNVFRGSRNAVGIWNEMGHGPLLVDNNIFLGTKMQHSDGAGTVLVHNLFYKCGDNRWASWSPGRHPGVYDSATCEQLEAPVAELEHYRYYNNVFIDNGLKLKEDETIIADYNLHLDGAHPDALEGENSLVSSTSTSFSANIEDRKVSISFSVGSDFLSMPNPRITPSYIGDMPPADYRIDSIAGDFFGVPLPNENPHPGPFQNLVEGTNEFTVWAVDTIPTRIAGKCSDQRDMNPASGSRRMLGARDGESMHVYDLMGRRITESELNLHRSGIPGVRIISSDAKRHGVYKLVR